MKMRMQRLQNASNLFTETLKHSQPGRLCQSSPFAETCLIRSLTYKLCGILRFTFIQTASEPLRLLEIINLIILENASRTLLSLTMQTASGSFRLLEIVHFVIHETWISILTFSTMQTTSESFSLKEIIHSVIHET
jgi:hypothetical protein